MHSQRVLSKDGRICHIIPHLRALGGLAQTSMCHRIGCYAIYGCMFRTTNYALNIIIFPHDNTPTNKTRFFGHVWSVVFVVGCFLFAHGSILNSRLSKSFTYVDVNTKVLSRRVFSARATSSSRLSRTLTFNNNASDIQVSLEVIMPYATAIRT